MVRGGMHRVEGKRKNDGGPYLRFHSIAVPSQGLLSSL